MQQSPPVNMIRVRTCYTVTISIVSAYLRIFEALAYFLILSPLTTTSVGACITP